MDVETGWEHVTITALWHRLKYIPLYTCRVLLNQGTSASLARFSCVQALVQNCSLSLLCKSQENNLSSGQN